MSSEPSHKIFIDRFLDINKVKQRLRNYPAIKEFLDHEQLDKYSASGPFYCHWLIWRLGTWENEKLFSFFDNLLCFGKNLGGWNKTKSREVTNDPSWNRFWSFLWELQMAKALDELPNVQKIEWLASSGPDLKVITDSGCFYVECHVYNKSFYLEEFVREILNKINPRLRISHAMWTNHQLLKNNNIEYFLDEIFSHFLNERELNKYLTQADSKHPVIIQECLERNFQVWMDGDESNGEYHPDIIREVGGDPESYLQHALRESIPCEKKDQLESYHPNFLAINHLLNEDFQSAFHRQCELSRDIPIPDLEDWLDGVLYVAGGIDGLPRFDKRLLKLSNPPQEELLRIF